MPIIPLTKGQFTSVSTCDYEFLVSVGRWCFSKSGYACHYFTDDAGQHKTLYMHRVIMERILGHPIPFGLQVDHISVLAAGSESRLDNVRSNIRLSTGSQNQAHKGAQVNTRLYKGVSWNHGKWLSRIKYGSRRIILGSHKDALTAALLYDAASRYFYHEFAGCNFPELETPPYIEDLLKSILERYGI